MDIRPGDCVQIPDGRIARLRSITGKDCMLRVRRKTSKTNQFLNFPVDKIRKVACPDGWMSPEGYKRYLKKTLAKMHRRVK